MEKLWQDCPRYSRKYVCYPQDARGQLIGRYRSVFWADRIQARVVVAERSARRAADFDITCEFG